MLQFRMRIDFGRACQDIFSTPNKWMTILGLIVCMLIPIVGQMVALGYLIRRFTREREGKPAEDFVFNYFGEYLMVGLWPTVATLVMSLIIVPFAIVFMIPIMIAPLLTEQNEILMIILILAGSLLYTIAIFIFTLFLFPVLIRSGLTMDFKSGFSWTFIRGFIRRVGLSLMGYYLLLVLVSIPFMLLGYLALFVGVYVVAAWLQVAMYHLVFQHYDLYLERGGEPIPVHPEVTKVLGLPPRPAQGETPPPL